MKICRVPFEFLEIYDDGKVNSCCPWYNNFLSFGNIYCTDFEKVWNSEVAVDLRTKLLNNDYSLCNLEICPTFRNEALLFDPEIVDYKPIMQKYPKMVNFCHDSECNLTCMICRDKIIVNSENELTEKNNNIEKVFLPLLKDAEMVSLSGLGDPFASRHCRKLISAISSTYPDIKFKFATNATSVNKNLLVGLGVIDKIYSIFVSMHALSKNTYEKIMRGGDFKKLLENLKLFSEMKKENKIEEFSLIFVVNSLNYKEMPKFVEFAEKHNAKPVFWEYRKNGTEMDDKYKEYAIFEPTHKDHHKLLKVLKHKNFNREIDPLHPLLRSLVNKNK